MTVRPVKTFFPKTRLAEMAAQLGGIARDEAIAGAKESVELLREEGDTEINRSIGAIEAIVAGSDRRSLQEADMRKILQLADQIVTLAGTFGYTALDKVMRSLCDVTDGLLQARLTDAAPIIVHVQSMRLMAPGSTALSPQQTAKVLGELAKILTHYNFCPLAAQNPSE
jgi:hypothetical protein